MAYLVQSIMAEERILWRKYLQRHVHADEKDGHICCMISTQDTSIAKRIDTYHTPEVPSGA